MKLKKNLNFLDISIIKQANEDLFTNWYTKETFSGRYLNYLSNSHMHQKIAVKNLVDTVFKLTNQIFHNKNFEKKSVNFE